MRIHIELTTKEREAAKKFYSIFDSDIENSSFTTVREIYDCAETYIDDGENGTIFEGYLDDNVSVSIIEWITEVSIEVKSLIEKFGAKFMDLLKLFGTPKFIISNKEVNKEEAEATE